MKHHNVLLGITNRRRQMLMALSASALTGTLARSSPAHAQGSASPARIGFILSTNAAASAARLAAFQQGMQESPFMTSFTGRCRSCLDRLLAAAHALTVLPEGRSDWGAFGGPVPPAESPGYAREAQRAVRCLAVMQQLVEGCQVRTGTIITFGITCQGLKRA